jgi:hypothetical protein
MSLDKVAHKLFELLKGAWPCTEAVPDADELAYIGDCISIKCLMDEIFNRLRDYKAELIMPPAIEGLDFWIGWDWNDTAAEQLAQWRAEIDGMVDAS